MALFWPSRRTNVDLVEHSSSRSRATIGVAKKRRHTGFGGFGGFGGLGVWGFGGLGVWGFGGFGVWGGLAPDLTRDGVKCKPKKEGMSV